MGKIKTIRYHRIYLKKTQNQQQTILYSNFVLSRNVSKFFVVSVPFLKSRDCRTDFVFPRALWEKFRIVEQVSEKSTKVRKKRWKGKPEITTQEEKIFFR